MTTRRSRAHAAQPAGSDPKPAPAGGEILDRFPHERPAALDLARLPTSGGSRRALAALTDQLVVIYADSINELRETAERCRVKGDHYNEIGARRAVGMLSLKAIEQAHGRRLSMDVNVRNQEDLIDLNRLSPETQELIVAALNAVERERAALPAPSTRLGLPMAIDPV